MLNQYKKEAAQFCEAIRKLTEKPDNLQNLECYLCHCFGEWMEKYANDPQNICAEMKEFAEMKI